MLIETDDAEADMAANRKPPNKVAAEPHIKALTAALGDRSAFEAALTALQADKSLKVNDICFIATTYGAGGTQPKTRKDALEKIKRRFVEIVRAAKNAVVASDTRLW